MSCSVRAGGPPRSVCQAAASGTVFQEHEPAGWLRDVPAVTRLVVQQLAARCQRLRHLRLSLPHELQELGEFMMPAASEKREVQGGEGGSGGPGAHELLLRSSDVLGPLMALRDLKTVRLWGAPSSWTHVCVQCTISSRPGWLCQLQLVQVFGSAGRLVCRMQSF
jgi:hypothetical protein